MPHRFRGRARLLSTRRRLADGASPHARGVRLVADISIRKATDADRDAIARLYVQLKRHHNALASDVSRYSVTDDAWAEMVLDAMSEGGREEHFYVAERDGEPIAFVRLFYEQKAFGLACEVETLVVDESSRGAGIGDELMSHAETVARGSGAKAMRVNVFSVNAEGRRFYEERGYQMVAARYGKDL